MTVNLPDGTNEFEAATHAGLESIFESAGDSAVYDSSGTLVNLHAILMPADVESYDLGLQYSEAIRQDVLVIAANLVGVGYPQRGDTITIECAADGRTKTLKVVAGVSDNRVFTHHTRSGSVLRLRTVLISQAAGTTTTT